MCATLIPDASIDERRGLIMQPDASNNNFAPGQLYTALSRAKKMENIKLINLDKEAFLINKNVLNYYNS